MSTRALVLHGARDLRVEARTLDELAPADVRIKVAKGGICGSDLHYFLHGGIGSKIKVREPIILGHEVSGYVAELGADVTGLSAGDLVAISPSRPCCRCRYCAIGLHNHCEHMRFYGSAMPFPHIQGAFCEELVAHSKQCVAANGLSAGEAAMAEPLSVCLHAAKRAGNLLGKRVLITGSGPIGVLCVLIAKAAGASKIVVTDLVDEALIFAHKAGAHETINVANNQTALTRYQDRKGTFDYLFECSGAEAALAAGIAALCPRGILLQLGLGGDMTVPMQMLTAKEIDLRGSFRFHEEFEMAVRLMQSGAIDLKPLISNTVSFDDAVSGFELASDRSRAMKIQIAF